MGVLRSGYDGYVGDVSLNGMVFGMPPNTHLSDTVMKASMPTATIIPCEPKFDQGLSLFQLDSDKGMIEYQKILNSVGFSFTDRAIKVAYLADNFPTDTFNNEYGETFLDKFADAASSGVGDLAQILGITDSKQITNAISNAQKNASNSGGVLGMAADMIGGAAGDIKSLTEAGFGAFGAKGDKLLSSMVKTMGSIATGGRVDFPQVWKNSSFTPSYSITIRLYNPNPSSAESTRKYIVGPIAALVALGVPKVGEDSSTYKWPLICKVRSPGIYHLNAAYINSIAVIKGGDQQSIAYNQALAMCDVRIDFGSLYNSILAGTGTNSLGHNRPTLGTYLEAIGGKSISSESKNRGKIVIASKGPGSSSIYRSNIKVSKKQSNKTNTTEDIDPRADEKRVAAAAILSNQTPAGMKPS